jgi:hypothetical protein
LNELTTPKQYNETTVAPPSDLAEYFPVDNQSEQVDHPWVSRLDLSLNSVLLLYTLSACIDAFRRTRCISMKSQPVPARLLRCQCRRRLYRQCRRVSLLHHSPCILGNQLRLALFMLQVSCCRSLSIAPFLRQRSLNIAYHCPLFNSKSTHSHASEFSVRSM